MDENRKVKQVIVFRKDLINGEKFSISSGKIGAQCAHASNAALLKLFEKKDNKYEVDIEPNGYLDIWLNGIFTKIMPETGQNIQKKTGRVFPSGRKQTNFED